MKENNPTVDELFQIRTIEFWLNPFYLKNFKKEILLSEINP